MRWLRAGFLPVSVVTLVAAALLVPLPLFLERPGAPLSLGACVEMERGAADELNGDFLLTTVHARRAALVDIVLGAADPHADVVGERSLIPPGVSSRDYFSRQRAVFRTTADVAAAVGFRAAGLRATVEGRGARVAHVFDDLPAAGVLRVGDVITAVGGERVGTDLDLRDAIARQPTGRPLHLDVRRREQTLRVELTPVVVEGTPVIGVAPVPVDLRVTLPVDVSVRSGRVAGPSAGLMIALTVYDKTSGGVDLAAGRVIAGTGTLDHQGNVGTVGGVGLKALAAHDAGADVFVVPEANMTAARAGLPAGSDVEIVGAATFEQARDALAGGADDSAARQPAPEATCPYGDAT